MNIVERNFRNNASKTYETLSFRGLGLKMDILESEIKNCIDNNQLTEDNKKEFNDKLLMIIATPEFIASRKDIPDFQIFDQDYQRLKTIIQSGIFTER
mgnify:CR=1 FL=1